MAGKNEMPIEQVLDGLPRENAAGAERVDEANFVDGIGAKVEAKKVENLPARRVR